LGASTAWFARESATPAARSRARPITTSATTLRRWRFDFDPAVISFEKLLDILWASHDPTERAWSRQYKAAIFFHGPAQEAVARRSRDAVAARLGRAVETEVVAAGTFWPAEDYHQKYYLRRLGRVARELLAIYGDDARFRDSTAAARANGYVGGHGTAEAFRREIGDLGLSVAAQEELARAARMPAASCSAVAPGK
jgi:peptide-methionine (S)-S-oxide reductase